MQYTAEKPLKILNASAGSGKTFNLVKEYIQLLLCDAKNTYRFTNIIAMTFTNKAALEMKSRIIQALDELSFPEKYLKKSNEYALLIADTLGINPEEVHERARIVLKNILHKYEDFNVMTIDKFNLKLIRSFSRDLNLPNDFEIILNENEVIERVVDTMMSQLGQIELEKLTQLVFSYAKENIEEGEKWDFRKSLIQFASILQKENYFSIVEQLMEGDFSKEMLQQLKFEKKRMEDRFVEKCNTIYQLYQNENINEKDLPGGSHTSNPIKKLNTYKSIPNKKEFFTDTFLKTCEKEVPPKKIFPQLLKNNLLELNQIWKEIVPQYTGLSLYIKNFYNMALLQFMAKQLDNVRKDEQLIRISEFNKLISELVKNEEAPFIYERLGIRFHHFLLDEFQDTSHLQWLNMVPLLHESISQKNINLIVGDPKQSIYRFKNGVAEQFVALPAIYNPDADSKIAKKSNYFNKMGEILELKDNYRSSPVIVNFNNQFFEYLKNELDENFKPFYNSIHQNPKSKKEGYIEIISKIGKESEITFDINQLLKWISECEEDGFKRGEICLLGDKNKDCAQWANALTKLNFEVVSTDSLLVDNSPAVKLTIAYLRRRLNPISENEKRRFAEKYFRMFPNNSYKNYMSYLDIVVNENTGKTFKKFNDNKFITDCFGTKVDFFSKYENIYDLIQKFYTIAKFNELNDPYLHHLADMAHEYDLSKGPDLKGFLDYYLSKGKKSAVQLPESENAIKIMSIHKSKGLEFPVVILPNFNFDLGINSKSRFLIPTSDKILYTPQGKESPIQEIKNFTENELGQIKTDTINKCYVAMTRPIERLYIYKEETKPSDFSKIFDGILTQLNGEKSEIEDTNTFIIGTRNNIRTSEKTIEAPHFIPHNVTDRLWFPDISLQDSENLKETNLLSEAQRFGNQLHLLLSMVNNSTEIDTTIQLLSKSGEIENQHIERLTIEAKELFNNISYQELLNNSIEILNEQAIIINTETIIRPDKIIIKQSQQDKLKAIVIDYKTGLPQNKYTKQLKEYIFGLQELGYKEVEGYIFYTSTKVLEQIS